MNYNRIRSYLKTIIPKYMWHVISCSYTYFKRLQIWPILLWQIRGFTKLDQIKLIWAAIYAPIISMKDLSNWQDPQILSDCKVVIKNIGTFVVRKNSDDLYHLYPRREKNLLKYHFNKLKEGDIYIDAGANIGFYTILASKLVGENGKVIAIEMIPETMKILKHNCELNNVNNVIFIDNALTDSDNEIVKASVYNGHFGQSSVNFHGVLTGESIVNVHTTTLDSIFSKFSLQHVKLLKMDIEGAEILALKGGLEALIKIDSIIFEELFAAEKSEINILLRKNSFNIIQLDERNRLAFRNN